MNQDPHAETVSRETAIAPSSFVRAKLDNCATYEQSKVTPFRVAAGLLTNLTRQTLTDTTIADLLD